MLITVLTWTIPGISAASPSVEFVCAATAVELVVLSSGSPVLPSEVDEDRAVLEACAVAVDAAAVAVEAAATPVLEAADADDDRAVDELN